MSTPTLNVGDKCRVKFNAEARDAHSLSVKRGDVVQIIDAPADVPPKAAAHYVKQLPDGASGFVQSVYLTHFDTPTAPTTAPTSTPSNSSNNTASPVRTHRAFVGADSRQSWSPSSMNAAAIQYALAHGGAAPPPNNSSSGSSGEPGRPRTGTGGRGSFIKPSGGAGSSLGSASPVSGSPVTGRREPAPPVVRSGSLTDAAAGAATPPAIPNTPAPTVISRPVRVASAGTAASPASSPVVAARTAGSAIKRLSGVPPAAPAGADTTSPNVVRKSPPAAPAAAPVVPAAAAAAPAAADAPRLRPDSSAHTAAIKEKFAAAAATTVEPPKPAARPKPAAGAAAGAVQAASQIFEQMSYAQRKLGAAGALPAAWTSSRRSSPVASPRGEADFSNALPDESSSDDSDPLPPPVAQITKAPTSALAAPPSAAVEVSATGQRTPSNPPTARSGGSGGDHDEDSGTGSHSIFDVSELQELKRRLQLKKASLATIKVQHIEMINDDADSDDDESSSDDVAEKASRRKSKKKTSSRSRSSAKNLSLRRRKKSSEEAPVVAAATAAATAAAAAAAAAATTSPPPPPPSDSPPEDSPRKSTSTRDRPRDPASSRGRKVRTLPRNARSSGLGKHDDASSDDAADSSEDSPDPQPPTTTTQTQTASSRHNADDDIWAKLIAMEKEKQLRRERRKKAEQAAGAGVEQQPPPPDEDEAPVPDENKSGSMRRRNRRSKAPAARIMPPSADAPKFSQVFAAVSDESSIDSPRGKLTSMGFVAEEDNDDAAAAANGNGPAESFGAFFQEEPVETRGVQFAGDTKGDGASLGTPLAQTRARSKSVSERMRSLQPVTLGAIKEKQQGKSSTKIDADPDAAAVAAVVAAAVAATAASHESTLGGSPAPAPAAAAGAGAAAAAKPATPTGGRPKVCQHCVAMAVEAPGKVAARVVTPDGVELFLCKSCTTDFQKRDGSAAPVPSAALPVAQSFKVPAVSAAQTAATTASRLSASSRDAPAAATTPPPPPTTAPAEEASRFSLRGIKQRLSGRYKLQRDAEGNVITIDKVAGVTGGAAAGAAAAAAAPAAASAGGEAGGEAGKLAESGSRTPVLSRLGQSSKSARSGGDDDDEDDEDGGGGGGDALASSNRLRRELAAVQTRHAIGFDIGRRTDDIVVVIDPGSATTKVGFSGEAAPRAVLPTWVRYMEAQRKMPSGVFGQPLIPVAEGTLPDRPGFIGEDPSVPKLRSMWKHPVERGVVRDWDEMEKILEYSFDFELKADPEDHPVIMTDGSPLSNRLQRERAVQIMFETFNVPSTYLALQSAMSLLACGELTGLVVTIGDGVTCAVPIYEGFPIRHSIHTLDRAGADLTTHLVDLVNDSMQASDEWARLAPGETEQLLFDSTSHSDRYQFEQLKRKYCYVARQSLIAEEKAASESRYKFEKHWTTLDGRKLPLLHERYLACEPLFAPSRIGGAEMHWLDETGASVERRHVNCEGIHRLAYASIRKCDKSIRKTLLEKVFLAGGSSRIDGMTDRMAEELKSLLVGTHLAKAKVAVSGGKASDEYSEWVGASMFASLSAFQSSAISRDEYLEVGPSVVHRRCA